MWGYFPLEKTQCVGRRKGVTFIKPLSFVADPAALIAFMYRFYLPSLFTYVKTEARRHDVTCHNSLS